MKRVYLKFYAKIVAAMLSAMVAFTACCTPKSAKKTEKIAESNNTSPPKDTIPTYKKGTFNDEVIAMYGVRPDRRLEIK